MLVTGGCRSGKSAYAERAAKHFSDQCLYIATAEIHDEEMLERVRKHQEARGNGWRLHECRTVDAIHLWQRLPALAQQGEALLFDCLSLWTASCMQLNCSLALFEEHCARLLAALRALHLPVVIVSSEVGMGVVPPSREGRLFRDMAGLSSQMAAAEADSVVFMVSGIPLAIKGELPCVK